MVVLRKVGGMCVVLCGEAVVVKEGIMMNERERGMVVMTMVRRIVYLGAGESDGKVWWLMWWM